MQHSALEKDLQASVDGEIRFSDGDRALYANDASNYRQVPVGVVIPRSIDDLARTVNICARHGVPILHRGAGTSLAGQTVNEHAVIIDSSKYCNHIVSIDPERRLATVEPGCILDSLNGETRKQHDLVFGADPATHTHCTLGGVIGNNSGGVHALVAGVARENVHQLEIMTYDGEHMVVGETPPEKLEELCARQDRTGQIYRDLRALRDRYADEIRARSPDIPRRVSGYSLVQLLPEKNFHVARALVGSEGTCVNILRATVNLMYEPPCKTMLVIGWDDICSAADAVPELLGFDPFGLEAIDDLLVDYIKKKKLHEDYLKYLPEGDGWLLMQFAADTADEARAKAEKVQEHLKDHPRVVDTKLHESGEPADMAIWEIRESGLGATAWVYEPERDTWPGWEDSAVHPDRLGEYLRALKALYAKYDYHGAMYGHFGDGLIHTRVDFGLHSQETVARFHAFMEEAAHLVTRMGGTLSGEHGDGQARSQLLRIMYGDRMVEAFDAFKHIWDPDNKMNPHDVVRPKKLDEDLRFGPHFRPEEPQTMFRYPETRNSFIRSTMRCVGVGKCRVVNGGTMCPSYRGTLEEKHSTRGRARLFQEVFQNGPLHDTWQSEELKDALDLCLACKACRSECPVNVDMATYKSEFLYQHYRNRRRPREDLALGNIRTWAELTAEIDDDALDDTLAVAMPFHGDVTLFGNGSFEYDHDGTEALADSFLYRIVDTSSESDTAMVRLDVVLVNDRPFITAPDSFTVAEGDTFPLVDLVPLGFDGDDDQETLTWQVFGGGELGVDLSADFVLEVAIPDEEWNGSEVLVLRLRDPLGAYSDAAVTFAVTPVNDTPVVSVLPSQVVSAGGSFLPIPLDSFVADVDHDDAEIVWTYRNHEPLQVEIDAGRNLTVTAPSVGWTGNVSMILRATDPEGAWAERPCHFVVSPAGK